jgi:hypothetical protein
LPKLTYLRAIKKPPPPQQMELDIHQLRVNLAIPHIQAKLVEGLSKNSRLQVPLRVENEIAGQILRTIYLHRHLGEAKNPLVFLPFLGYARETTLLNQRNTIPPVPALLEKHVAQEKSKQARRFWIMMIL